MPKKAINEVNEFDEAAWTKAFESMTAERVDENDQNAANVREAAEMVTTILDKMVWKQSIDPSLRTAVVDSNFAAF
eukprot:SAG31_NODE_839_length_11600_cov_3.351013_9_plen_76_part_00